MYANQTFTILSQQNKGDIGTFKLHNMYKLLETASDKHCHRPQRDIARVTRGTYARVVDFYEKPLQKMQQVRFIKVRLASIFVVFMHLHVTSVIKICLFFTLWDSNKNVFIPHEIMDTSDSWSLIWFTLHVERRDVQPKKQANISWDHLPSSRCRTRLHLLPL